MCETAEYLPIDDLENFQGDLKPITKSELEKLKKSIIKYGFSFPVFVWNNKILDGHQRLIAVKSLMEDDYTINDNVLPIVRISAKDEKEAAEKLLLINSRYAKIDQAGFNIYIADFNIDIGEFGGFASIPEVSFETLTNDQKDDTLIEKDHLEYKILIDCEDEQEQLKIMNTLENQGLQCKPLIL